MVLRDNKGRPIHPQTTIELVTGLQNQIDTINERIDTVVHRETYTHVQDVASNTWNINHNLGRYPSVSVVDSAGTEIICEVRYIDSNNLQCLFNGILSGIAYLN